MKPLGHQPNVVAETIMIAPAAGFYSNPHLVKTSASRVCALQGGLAEGAFDSAKGY